MFTSEILNITQVLSNNRITNNHCQ